jgi:hypothetical protein
VGSTRSLQGAVAASGDAAVAVWDHPPTSCRGFRIVERLYENSMSNAEEVARATAAMTHDYKRHGMTTLFAALSLPSL